MVELLAEHHALPLTLEDRAAGGEVGAYFGRCEDGRRVVFKWFERLDWQEPLNRTLTGVGRLRSRGYPIPKHEHLMVIPGGLVVVQAAVERGQVVDRITHGLLDELMELNALQHGEAYSGEDWSTFIIRTLTVGADGWCLHEPLRRHSLRTAAILDQIERIGASLVGLRLPQADIMHMDFHHRNILQDRGQVVAVIDWEGSMPGDRVFDLVTLAFCTGTAVTDQGVEESIWNCVRREGEPTAGSAYVAHMALRRLDWTIRHHADEVDYWSTVATRQLSAHG